MVEQNLSEERLPKRGMFEVSLIVYEDENQELTITGDLGKSNQVSRYM